MAQNPQDLPNWITAVSTAITGIAAFLTGLFAWLSLRRDRRRDDPIIEANFEWGKSKHAGLLGLRVVARNMGYETIVLDSIRVVRPSKMTICREDYMSGRLEYFPSPHRKLPLQWTIDPVGSERRVPLTWGDALPHQFYFTPPLGWSSGTVEIELRISSRTLSIRDRRITIKRHVTVAPITKTDASTSK